jgi:tetratricopeptide (TPR) repeat protein
MDNSKQKHDSWMNRYRERINPNFEEYTEIIKSNNSVLENINKGVALISNCSYKEAIRILTVAIDTGEQLLSDDNLLDENELAKAYINRGVAYENLNNHEDALSDKTESVDMLERICRVGAFPDENLLALAYMNRGQTYSSMEKYNDALEDAEQSIEIWERMKSDGERIDEHSLSCAYANKSIASIKVEPLLDEKNMSGYDENELAASHTMRGLNHFQNELFDESISYFNKSIEIMERLRTYPEIIAARAYAGRGMAYHCLGKHEQALPDITKSIDIWERHLKEDKSIEKNMLFNAYAIRAGILNFTYQRADEAVSDCHKSIEIAEYLQKAEGDTFDKSNLATVHMIIGVSYDQQEKFEKANEHYDECIKIWEELKIDESSLALAYMNRGANYYQTGKNEKALEDYRKCINIGNQLEKDAHVQDTFDMVMAYKNRAMAYELDKKLKEAIECNKAALRIIKQVFSEKPNLQGTYYGSLIETIEMVVNKKDEEHLKRILDEFLYSMRHVNKTEEAEEFQNKIIEKVDKKYGT